MSDVVIRTEGLGKKYLIGHTVEKEGYTALRDVVARNARGLLRSAADMMRGRQLVAGDTVEEFWALKDVSFEVRRAEVVGVIGGNGAGKSTLLKILSRITEPSEGRVEIKGRVASLLEVGTGFHPELSGRENIYLNGAILGMSRREIRRKFDEIVDFAEVERFLDTPVKRYSSGMYVRLAFAVAAHLDPEILVIDEVLAVGDAEFQKKCLGKMSEVACHGRTVLFVSHNIGAVNRLCQSCVLLEGGRLKAQGKALDVSSKYLVSASGTGALRTWPISHQRPGDTTARLISLAVRQHGVVTENTDIRNPVEIEMTYDCLIDGAQLISCFTFFDDTGTLLFVTADFGAHDWSRPRSRGTYRSTCEVPGNIFAEGFIRITAEVSTRSPVYQNHFLVQDGVGFNVVDSGERGSVRAGWGRPIPGVMRPMCSWRTAHKYQMASSDLSSAQTVTCDDISS